MPKTTVMEGVSISFNSPITLIEKLDKDDNQMKIGGVAVPAEQASRNGRTYKLEDLQKAKFGGKVFTEGRELTMGLNHSDDVTDNVGRWIPTFTEKGVEFKGMAYNTGKHPYIVDMLNKNLLPYVSVEMIADLVKENDVLYATNQDILGLDFVKVPGLANASANIAEAFEKAVEAELTTKTRKELPDSAFVFPGERRYPIHDIAHAKNALARVSQHGTPEEKAKVKAAVYRKYPELKTKEAGDTMTEEKLIEQEEENPEQPEKKEEQNDMEKCIASQVAKGKSKSEAIAFCKDSVKKPEAESKNDSLIEKIFDKLDKKVDELGEDVRKLKEKPQSKGVVTEKTKSEFNLTIKDGKKGKDIYSEEFVY